jgi:hypothetical protein
MSLASLVTRLVGLWILAGATLKLLYGTPVDLPEVIQDLPLSLGLTFKLAIGLELLVGVLALLRPARGGLPVLLLCAAFLVVLITQVADGAESCGCFGTALTVSPVVMLVIDGLCFVLLLVVRPWRDRPAGPEMRWAVLLILFLCAAVAPWLLDREGQLEGGTVVGRPWVDLDVPSYVGKPFSETKLYPLLPDDLHIEDGVIVIYRLSCEVCAEHLDVLASRESGDRTIVLLKLAETDEESEVKVHVLPEGPWVKKYDLPGHTDWLVTPPAHIEIVKGICTVAVEGMDSLDVPPPEPK